MAYVSLYRKYRPGTFAEVVGQDHVTQTLAAAVTSDRLSHAYLFTGPRGTGKTSTARILSKALNCEQGPTAEPDGTCAQCVAVTDGSSVDVIEIDAASHGGVDDVRDLRDRVAFAPVSARRKVYIVDECHMLSAAGWNAFLKTVEEPPGHVVFVFATTEPHKVPETILSRTQRFDFRRVAAQTLAGHLEGIAAREGITLESGAVDLLVRAGDGSVRDCLSVLDQVVAFTGASVTLRGVTDVLGAAPDALLSETAELLASADVAGLCVLVGRLADAGHDLRQFAKDAVEHLRRLFLLQVAPSAGLVEGPPEQLARLQGQAGRLGRVELLRAVELLGEAQAQMRRGNTRLPLEIALVKAALPESSGNAAALAARMDRLERRVGLGAGAAASPAAAALAARADSPAEATSAAGPASVSTPAPAAARHDPAPPAPPSPSPAPSARGRATAASTPKASAAPPAPPDGGASAFPAAGASGPSVALAGVDLELVQGSWDAVLAAVKDRKRSLQMWLTEGHPSALDGSVLELQFRASRRFHADNCAREDSQALLGDVFEQVLGERLRVSCTVSDEDDGPPEAVADAGASLDEQAAAVLESEAAAVAGTLPDEAHAHERAVQTLTRDLGARIVEE